MILLKIVISDTVLLALIGVVTTLISSLTVIITTRLNKKVDKVEHQINSRMDELLKISKAQALAEGNIAGRAEEKAEQAIVVGVASTPIIEAKIEGAIKEGKIEGEIKGVIKPDTKKL